MITKNFKNLLGSTLMSSGNTYGYLPVQSVTGRMYYLCPNFDRFPYSRTASTTTSATTAGISIGNSSDAESDTDYNLHGHISSGVNITITNTIIGEDSPGDPYIQYNLTITNTSSQSITVGEVGYKQIVRASSGPGRNENNEVVVLLDRSVLTIPITIAAGDAGVVVYKMKTTPTYPVKGGIPMVPWSWGTDQQIADMIDAAQLGTIDLHEDGGWNISDIRKIHLPEFVDESGTTFPEQDIELIIASFDEYNECGNVIQFDFHTALSVAKRLNASNTMAGGYGETELHKKTISSIEAALPTWIRNRLRTFTVKSWNPSTSELVDIENCKLALRAKVELYGSSNVASDAEGSHIPLYAMDANLRPKRRGYSGSNADTWTRTAYSASNAYYMYYYYPTSLYNAGASNSYGIAPFGCM